MKRLRYGEFLTFTEEEKKKHLNKLHENWLNKPGNREKMQFLNKIYQDRHAEKVKNTPYKKRCSKCGKIKTIYGRRIVCDECASKPTQLSLTLQKRKERQELIKERNNHIIFLATTTNMTQKEIADEVGTWQERVSQILRANGIHRVRCPRRKGSKNVKECNR